MTKDRETNKNHQTNIPAETRLVNSYYAVLGLHPSASVIEIRRAYRDLSKLYHPDTTKLPSEIAKSKFHRLNEAYGTLSNPERRSLYDLKIGYSRLNVIQVPSDLNQAISENTKKWSNSAYLDPTDRPLSAGEIFALFILGLTIISCLILAIAIALLRGDPLFPNTNSSSDNVVLESQKLSFMPSEQINPTVIFFTQSNQ